MADYRKFTPFILRWEGGEVNDKSDRGGHTNKGITRTTFNALSRRVLGKEPTLANFKNISKEDAMKFIHYFWNKATGNNQIKSQAVAEAMTSWFWGSGAYGIKEWQRMLRDKFGKTNIIVDGGVGKQTIDYTNSIPENELMKQAIATREQTFRKLVKRDPRQAKFLKGWLRFLRKCFRESK
jgi:lysozyme family protein